MSALSSQTSLHGGAYVIEGVIGRGGFGITYRARDVEEDREVAIKECFPAGCERRHGEIVAGDFFSHAHCESFQNRFRAQAEHLKGIAHPNLMRVFDCFDENGTVYLVMELVEGPTLQTVIEQRPIALEEARHWVERLAAALGALHAGGLLHLDVKPENAILRGSEPILLDFDLVQPKGEVDFSTRPLSMAMQCGTPGYAPLEQYAQTGQLSPATDLYALGATFYHLLAGHAPLSAIDRIAGSSLRPPAEFRDELEPHLSAAILRALEIKSEARPADAREFLLSLDLPAPDPDEDDDAHSTMTLAPQMMKHGTGYHRIVLKERTPLLPKRCVCCHDKADPNVTWVLNSPSGRWELPFCDVCRRHQLAAKASGLVTFWGSILSLVLAVVVVVLSFITSSLLPLLLGPVCIVINFAALSYGALKSSRAEEMMKNGCCDPAEPAAYNFNGRVHIWRFKNPLYAEDFKKKNANAVI